MKRLLLIFVSLMLMNSAYAQVGKIRIRIADPSHVNNYFICTANAGCFSLLWSAKGKTYPMRTGMVNTIFSTNLATDRMFEQKLPASCHVNVQPGQTLTISGTLVVRKDKAKINGLHCGLA